MFRALLLATLAVPFLAVPAAAADCNPGFISFLPQIVRKEAVAAVDESYSVRLWSFCRGKEFHGLGNAAGLTRTIATNGYLREALAERGARPGDVRFVRIVGQTIDMWVHRN